MEGLGWIEKGSSQACRRYCEGARAAFVLKISPPWTNDVPPLSHPTTHAPRVAGHSSIVCGLSYHPNKTCLLSCSVDGSVILWE